MSRPASGGTTTPYRYLEHTADAGIEATGATLEAAFASAADGLAGWLCNRASVGERESRPFDLSAADLESLLVDWLNEVNFAFEVDRFAFRRFRVDELTATSLKATGYGEPLNPDRHHPGEQVKSVTYHGVKVERSPEGWLARVFLDI
jgi:SHS2 domain-containing protein